MQSQQQRLSQALEHSTDLLAASEDQADRLAAALKHAAARVEQQSAKTEASVRRAETLQRRADHATEVRNHIIAAAGALAAIAEEVVLLSQDRETGHETAVDSIYGERLLQATEAQTCSGKAAGPMAASPGGPPAFTSRCRRFLTALGSGAPQS